MKKNLTFIFCLVLLHIGTYNVAAQIIWNQTLPNTIGGSIVLKASVYNSITGVTSSGSSDVYFTTNNPNVAKLSGSNLPVTGYNNGATLTIVGAGTAIITATDYSGAFSPSVSKTIKVDAPAKSDQTITWNQTLSATYGDPPITLYASASSGLAVTYTSGNPSVAIVSGSTLTIKGAGTAIITASQNGNANYNAATSVSKTITVVASTKSNQTITWNQSDFVANYGDPPITLTATSNAVGNLPILYWTDDPNVATVGGNDGITLYFTGVGTTTLYAVQPGTNNYNASNQLSRSITVNQATGDLSSQTIDWTQTFSPSYNVGDPPITLTATASSNLPVSYTSSDNSVATITGVNVLNFIGAGTAIITAEQSGNSYYYPAQNQTNTITVIQNSQNPDDFFKPDPAAIYYIIHSSGFYFTTAVNPYPIYFNYYDALYYLSDPISYITNPDYSSDQQYQFVPVQGKTDVYYIMQVSTGEYLDAGIISGDNSDIFLMTCSDPTTDGDYTQFQMKSTGTGYYTITCLGVPEMSTYSCWGTDSDIDYSVVWTYRDGTSFLDYWNFKDVSETSINSVAVNTVTVYAKDGLLTINHLVGNNLICIYSISGQLIEKNEVIGSDYTKTLPTGSYIVVINGDSSYRSVVIVN